MRSIGLASLAAAAFLISTTGNSYAALNACAAGKQICMAKKVAALMKCNSKNTKPPGLDPAKYDECVQKAMAKFDGGTEPSKGCFAKLEAKFATGCLTTGDTAAMETRVDEFVTQTLCDLDHSLCAPETCREIKENSIAQTGIVPASGTYTLYVDGDLTKPWTAYCRNMNRVNPSEYLPVNQALNFSEVSNGTTVTLTRYSRLRIDPQTFVVDLLDDAFASTTEGDLPPPEGLSDIPAGWAQFVSPNNGDGPAATAGLDLAGTSFAMTEAVITSYFCTVTDGGTPVAPSGGEVTIAGDLKSFALAAINPVANSDTRVVADCANFGTSGFQVGELPLQYAP